MIHLVATDGTSNDPKDPHPTNVYRIAQATPDSIYVPGIGSEAATGWRSTWLYRTITGVTGAGATRQMNIAYDKLSEAYRVGDEIAIVSFSRGACVGRMLANKIHMEGIKAFRPGVKFLGCFDTVASFGVPGNQINLFKDFTVSDGVETALHLVALDESRDMFPVSLMNRRKGIVEKWVPGDHCDVGGGHRERGLANEAMDMMVTALREHGVEVGEPLRGDDTLKVHLSEKGITSPTLSPRLVGHLEHGKFLPGADVHYYDRMKDYEPVANLFERP